MASPDGSDLRKKRLQKIFDHACKQMTQEKYEFEYVTKMLTDCVLGDPANRAYLEAYVNNLRKKYGNNKKGAQFAQLQGLGARGAIKKARAPLTDGSKKTMTPEEFEAAAKQCLAILKINPWDAPTLTALAAFCEASRYGDCEMFCLKCAQESAPKDVEVNRQYAIALGKRGMYDYAIACWHRVEQVRPDDDEPKRSIASLTVQKQKARMGSDEEKRGGLARPGIAQSLEELTPIQKLKQKIAAAPDEVGNYLELAQLYINDETYKDAEEMLTRALKVSGNDPDVREKLEDAQLRHFRQKIAKLERQVEKTQSKDAQEQYKRLRQQLNEKEVEVARNRCERYPNNLVFKYELGVRYKIMGHHREAIKEFQQAQNDPRRKGVCLLALGECFQQVKQYPLAMRHYEAAVDEIPDRDADNKKLCLYRAGKLAMGLKDWDVAEKHLSVLAAMDFAYKDVSTLLDKIARLRNDEKVPAKDREQPQENGPPEEGE